MNRFLRTTALPFIGELTEHGIGRLDPFWNCEVLVRQHGDSNVGRRYEGDLGRETIGRSGLVEHGWPQGTYARRPSVIPPVHAGQRRLPRVTGKPTDPPLCNADDDPDHHLGPGDG